MYIILKHYPEVISAPPKADSAAALSNSCGASMPGSAVSTGAPQDFNQHYLYRYRYFRTSIRKLQTGTPIKITRAKFVNYHVM